MIENKREVYIQTSSGDQLLIEIQEQYGWIVVSHDGKRMDIDPDSIFDLIDALTIVANDVSSYVED